MRISTGRGFSSCWNTGVLEAPLGRGINFQIEMDSIEQVLLKLTGAEYPPFRSAAEYWYETADGLSGQQAFLAQDPDGYLLRFSQHLSDKPVPQKD